MKAFPSSVISLAYILRKAFTASSTALAAEGKSFAARVALAIFAPSFRWEYVSRAHSIFPESQAKAFVRRSSTSAAVKRSSSSSSSSIGSSGGNPLLLARLPAMRGAALFVLIVAVLDGLRGSVVYFPVHDGRRPAEAWL